MKKKHLFIAVAVIVVGALAIGLGALDKPQQHAEKGPEKSFITLKEGVEEKIGIKTDTAKAQTIDETLPLTGQIILNQNAKGDVKARFPGIVRSVAVQLGEKVTKGQTLAQIESNDSLQTYNVLAPLSGVLLARNTNAGDVAADTSLFTVADLSDVWAEFYVFPKNLDKVKQGMPIKIRQLDGATETTATISLLLPTADALSQTSQAIVVIPNPEEQWRPGMSVEGSIILNQQEIPVAVEEKALQRIDSDTIVFVKSPEGYEARPVKTGMHNDGLVEITEGLAQGEVYVTEGSFILKSELGKDSIGDDD